MNRGPPAPKPGALATYLAPRTEAGPVAFDRHQFQRDKYNVCRRSLRLWPVPVVITDPDADLRYTQMQAAVCVLLRDLLKIVSPEGLDIEDISFVREVPRSKIRSEVLVCFATVSERDEVISHAVNLKGVQVEAGVRRPA